VVVSCDEWNGRRVATVLGIEIVQGHRDDAGRYAPVVSVDARPFTIYGDQILAIPKNSMSSTGAVLSAEIMQRIDAVLDRALAGSTPSPRDPKRPPGHPYAGQVRFADLNIPGETDKPVVVISSEAYGAELGYALVIVCRQTSNPNRAHDFDVVLSPPHVGKVVVSSLVTIPVQDLRERTPSGSALSATERTQVMTVARRMLGLG
jgi:mRNA-degrading endonuclease toxin of MazEF toxin-antitoxin module